MPLVQTSKAKKKPQVTAKNVNSFSCVQEVMAKMTICLFAVGRVEGKDVTKVFKVSSKSTSAFCIFALKRKIKKL